MSKTTIKILLTTFFISCLCFPSLGAIGHMLSTQSANESDAELDGLKGKVHKVHTETIKVSRRGNEMVQGKPVVLETSTYDTKGKKINTIYHPNPNVVSLTGEEVYEYDNKGNIIGMTLTDKGTGIILNKEKYDYKFDPMGNWVEMTASVAIIEGGKLIFEVSEITKRTISYHFDTIKPSNSEPVKDAIDTNKGGANYRLVQRVEGPLNNKALSLPDPIYPPAAKAAKASGKVSVEVIIDISGKVISAKATSGHSLLHKAAETAALQAKFAPTMLSGQPVKVSGIIDYIFR
jgi:TonB family protein